MTIHCDKHTRFIPRCYACELLKLKNTQAPETTGDSSNLYQDAYTDVPHQSIKETRPRPKDPNTGRMLFDGRKYERVFVQPEKFAIIEYFFIDAESWGYEHYITIPNMVRGELILIFKKVGTDNER